MLSEELTNIPPTLEYKNIPNNSIFFGFKIKNKYDEDRAHINKEYNPGRYKIGNTFLYGSVFSLNSVHKNLITSLRNKKPFDIFGYSSLLEKFNLSCNNCFHNLAPPIYPIDSENIRNYLPEFSYENYIAFNAEIPKFQQFSSTNMFLISHD